MVFDELSFDDQQALRALEAEGTAMRGLLAGQTVFYDLLSMLMSK